MTEVWGQLSKAQDDDEKINEAIDSAVAVHEADASAHLGASESLQSHKAAEIIDHVVGSVVSDKLSMTEYQAKTIFEALDKWDSVGTVNNAKWPGVLLWSDYSPANPAELTSKDSLIPDYLDYSNDMMFQVVARIDETINKKVFFGYGILSSGDVIQGFGFKIVNGTLYGYLEADGSLATIVLSGVTLTVAHNYRAQWDASEKTCYFYVDGVEKGTLVEASPTTTADGTVLLRIEATASGECYLNIFELFTSREI